MLCIGYGREAAARRMRGLSPRREPLIRLRYCEGTFSHKGRREEAALNDFYLTSIHHDLHAIPWLDLGVLVEAVEDVEALGGAVDAERFRILNSLDQHAQVKPRD